MGRRRSSTSTATSTQRAFRLARLTNGGPDYEHLVHDASGSQSTPTESSTRPHIRQRRSSASAETDNSDRRRRDYPDPAIDQAREPDPTATTIPETVPPDRRIDQSDVEAQLDLEHHDDRKPADIGARILQRILTRDIATTTTRPQPTCRSTIVR